MRTAILLSMILLVGGCNSTNRVEIDDDVLISCMDDDVYRGKRSEYIEVLCTPYGRRLLWYSPDESSGAADELKNNWNKYWPLLQETYEDMIDDWDNPDHGSLAMLGDKWELQIDSVPEIDGRIIFSLKFVVDGKSIPPEWDVFMDDFVVTHSQPAF